MKESKKTSGSKKASASGKSSAKKRGKGKAASPAKKPSVFSNREVRLVCLLFLGLALMLSYFNAFGPVGNFIKNFNAAFFGSLSIAVPIMIIVGTIHIFIKGTLSPYKYRYVFTGMTLSCISGLHTLFFRNSSPDALFSGGVGSLLETVVSSGINHKSGGIIGALFALPLHALTGFWGALILLLLLMIIFFVTVTGTEPISRFIKYSSQMISEFIANIREEREREKEVEEIIKVRGVDEDDESVPKKKKKKKHPDKDVSTKDTQNVSPDKKAESDQFTINLYDGKKDKAEDKALSGSTKAEIPEEIKKAALEASGGIEEKKEDSSPIAVTDDEIESDYIPYTFPPIDLLLKSKAPAVGQDRPEDLRTQAKKLVDTLQSFGVEAKVLEVSKGPAVTRFELQPAAGVKVSKIVNLADDIALNLAAFGVRIEAPIPGKAAVGIEIPNKSTAMVALRDVIDSEQFRSFNSKTAFAMGKDISGQPIISDISKMPHMLIAGATGSGKSVCINSLITSILYKADPNQVKMILIDPKVVELGVYNGIPHLLIPVVTDPRRAAGALNWAVQEMVKRYSMFATANVRDIKGYNEYASLSGERQLEQIIIVIDELADLMMVSPHEVEDAICRLAQMARAAGMHLVIATQRPSVDVITGLIKANVPSRIAFSVSSQIDSRTILDMGGAEKLLGKGDMLFLPMGASKPKRLQGAFVSDKEIEKIVEFVKSDSTVHYNEDIIEHIENNSDDRSGADDGDADDLLPQAIEIVVELGQASASLLQRKLKVGYSRAGRLVDQLEERGIIGPHEGSKPRKVLMSKSEYQEMMVNNMDD